MLETLFPSLQGAKDLPCKGLWLGSPVKPSVLPPGIACALMVPGDKWKTHTFDGPFFQVLLNRGNVTHLIRGSQTGAAQPDIPPHVLSNCCGIKMVCVQSHQPNENLQSTA